MIQRDLIQLKRMMYYVSRYIMYSPCTHYTCAQARKKIVCDCVTEEPHHCVVLLQHCLHILVDVLSGVFVLRLLTFMMEVRANSA